MIRFIFGKHDALSEKQQLLHMWYHYTQDVGEMPCITYRDESNNSNYPIIWTLKFEIIIPTSEHLYTPCGARTGVAEHLLAFNSLCGATARITKRLLTYYSRFWISTRCDCGAWMGITKHVLTFDSLCGARTGVRKCLLAFYSLWTSLVIVMYYSVIVWAVIYLIFEQIHYCSNTPPPHTPFPGKIVFQHQKC